MNTAEVQRLIQLHLFRPFTIRLNHGFSYSYDKPERFGAPESIGKIRDLPNNPSARRTD
jgi:hypothetical protein